MSNDITELKLLLAELNTIIAVSEEKLNNKLGKTEFLEELKERDDDFYTAIDKVNDRINGLYFKVAGASGLIVGIIEILAAAS